MRSTNLNVLPENVKMQLQFIDQDAKAVQAERQKLVDAITKGGIPEDARAGAKQRQKQLEAQLQNIKDTRDKILSEAAAAQSERMGLPSGAGQGLGGPGLMPQAQSSSFVPMAMPTNIAAPQMTLRQEGDAVMPDNLPVLPGVKPTPKQAGTPRLYKIEGGKFKPNPNRIKESIEQAFADQAITEEQRAFVMRQAGF